MASVKVMTFNVRIDGPQTDHLPPVESATQTLGGEQRWALRKWKVADTVLTFEPDIVGFQEPYHNQVLDLADLLKSEYDWIGCGRNDGKEDGEYAPIFYKRDVVELESNKTIWLSKTPDQPGSKDWDANQTRIANFATFKMKGNDAKKFQVINTHFDNSGATARRESAIILLKELAAIFDPVVLMGDLNSTEDDGAYLELTCGRYTDKKHDIASQLIKLNDNHTVEEAKKAAAPVRTGEGHITLPTHIQFRRGKLDPANLKPLNERHGFIDARYELESRQDGYQGLSGPYGHYLTFTGFGNEGEDPPSRLDYILLANNVKATRYAVLENKYEDGLLISDHRPVMATVKF